MTAAVPLVEIVRGGVREGAHHGSVVVTAPDGSVLRAVGDVDSAMYPRSSNKPAQATGMLRAGLELPEQADLALAASSHSGESAHIARVRELLRRNGLSEDALRCPRDWPLNEAARDERAERGFGRQRIAMNCSGKHSAMLATCVQRGWSLDDYLDPKHPLQAELHATVTELAGEPIAATSVDGCGAPLFAISLSGLARMFSHHVTASPDLPRRRVADAMRAHPWLVSGSGRADSKLMSAVPGLLSKEGVEGVLALTLPDGHGIAIKIEDGAARARLPVAVATLRTLGLDVGELEALAEEPLFGGGERVGAVRPIPGVLD